MQALLWMAISTDRPLKLEYLSHQPATVFERQRTLSFSARGYNEFWFPPAVVPAELHEAYSRIGEPDEKPTQLVQPVHAFAALQIPLELGAERHHDWPRSPPAPSLTRPDAAPNPP